MECYFHPGEAVIGICALCLNERLLVLASRQDQQLHTRFAYKRNPIHLPKIFALSSLLNRLDLKHRKSDDDQCYSTESSGTQEDSFISIKFGDNGSASWEKSKVLPNPEVSADSCKTMALKQRLKINDEEDDAKAVIDHPIKASNGSLRWRKRIGHLFQLIKYWKRPPVRKGNALHVGRKLDRVKVRHGWIRTQRTN